MDARHEYAGDMKDWPKNERGKPTQAAVFGAFHPDRGKCCEILWTGKFPDLEPAMYWAAKKEVEAVRKGKWIMASRVLWQHDLTPEQAVEVCFKHVSSQIDDAVGALERGEGPIDGPGPMQPVDPSKAEGFYVEVTKKGDDAGDPIASFIAGPPTDDVSMNWGLGGSDDENDVPVDWVPRDPREE